MGPIAVGIDVGGTKVLGAVVDAATGEVLASRRVPTPTGSDALIAALADLVGGLVSSSGREPDAVGVGTAGLVDRAGVLRYSPNVPGVVDLALGQRLGEAVGVAVAVDNDATAAMVAEHRLGAARGLDDAVYVALGTGIGGAVVVDGLVRRGANGFAGEVGHVVVDPAGPRCACGLTGCWERLASGSALGLQARAAVADGRAPAIAALAGSGLVTGEHAVTAAKEGDPGAVAVIERFAHWIAIGLAGLVNTFDPALVVVGGGVVEAGEVLLGPLRRSFGPLVMGHAHRPEIPIEPARFGEQAAAIGAALLALDRAAAPSPAGRMSSGPDLARG